MGSNALFPVLQGRAWNITTEPQFQTSTQSSKSQREVRVSYTATPIYKISLNYEFLTAGYDGPNPLRADLEIIRRFFNARRGSFDSFLFKHWYDFYVTAEQIGVGDGVTTSFALGRDNDGAFEPILWPDTSVPSYQQFGPLMWAVGDDADPMWAAGDSSDLMWGGNVYSADSTEYTIADGVVTFHTAPSDGQLVVWSGQFFYRARFSTDSLLLNNMLAGLWELKQVDLMATLGDQI